MNPYSVDPLDLLRMKLRTTRRLAERAAERDDLPSFTELVERAEMIEQAIADKERDGLTNG